MQDLGLPKETLRELQRCQGDQLENQVTIEEVFLAQESAFNHFYQSTAIVLNRIKENVVAYNTFPLSGLVEQGPHQGDWSTSKALTVSSFAGSELRKAKPKAEVKAKVAVFKYLVTLAAEKKQSNRHKNCSSTPGNDSFANLIYKIEKCQQHFISTSAQLQGLRRHSQRLD